jgi:2OG-Fe(II) oxygenase superfamily
MLAPVQLMDSPDEGGPDDESEVDSLFDSASPIHNLFPNLPNTRTNPPNYHCADITIAQRTKPSISGLFFDPTVLIPEELAASLTEHTNQYFSNSIGSRRVNQVMFFGRGSEHGSGLPQFLDELIHTLSLLLQQHLSPQVHMLLFPPNTESSSRASRQAILNHYTVGEGIAPHVDLLTRFADGIVAVSLGSGTVMTFRRVKGDGLTSESGGGDRCDVYLPARSILVLTGDARYKWTHGIEGRSVDCVADEGEPYWIERETRVSVTLRWLLPGADVVGSE